MENKIRKLIVYWKDKQTDKNGHIWEYACEKFIENLQSLLKFKQENCCGKTGENENTKDKTK